jgi:hypothetical protein
MGLGRRREGQKSALTETVGQRRTGSETTFVFVACLVPLIVLIPVFGNDLTLAGMLQPEAVVQAQQAGMGWELTSWNQRGKQIVWVAVAEIAAP